MKVTNIHKRVIHQSKDKISQILDSLSSKDDQLWPYEQWPPFCENTALGYEEQHNTAPDHGMQVDRISIPNELDAVDSFVVTKHSANEVGNPVFVEHSSTKGERPPQNLERD